MPYANMRMLHEDIARVSRSNRSRRFRLIRKMPARRVSWRRSDTEDGVIDWCIRDFSNSREVAILGKQVPGKGHNR
jgi:hypothetical protein